jgi:hypothetical protein
MHPSFQVASLISFLDRCETTPIRLITSAIFPSVTSGTDGPPSDPSHFQPIISEPAGDDPETYPGMNPEKSGNGHIF